MYVAPTLLELHRRLQQQQRFVKIRSNFNYLIECFYCQKSVQISSTVRGLCIFSSKLLRPKITFLGIRNPSSCVTLLAQKQQTSIGRPLQCLNLSSHQTALSSARSVITIRLRARGTHAVLLQSEPFFLCAGTSPARLIADVATTATPLSMRAQATHKVANQK